MVAFDLETTGVDRFSDVPVSFALVAVEDGTVLHRQVGLVDPGRTIPDGAVAIHGITTERARAEGRPLDEIVEMLAEALVGAGEPAVPVVGMKLDFDLTIIDAQCRRIDRRGLADRGFVRPVIDALVLDRHYDRYRSGRRTLSHLCAHYDVTIANAHDAAADAEATVEVLAAMCRRFPDLTRKTPADLHDSQIGWHREWATSYDAWRTSKGMPTLDPADYDWPLPRVALTAPAI